MPTEKYPVTMPEIFEEFQCKGGSCRNTCCQQWNVHISRGEYNKIRHRCKEIVPENFFKRVSKQEATEEKYALIKMNHEGFCPLLSGDHMCTLQQKYGYPILPQICKQYPRLLHLIPQYHIYGACLDTGCERVLELLWDRQDTGIHFIQRAMSSNLWYANTAENLSFGEFIEDIRNLCIWILQNRAYSLTDRMIVLGFAIQELYDIEQRKAFEEVPAWFMKWQRQTKGNEMADMLSPLSGNRQWFVVNNLKTLLLSRFSHSLLPEVQNMVKKNIAFDFKDGGISYDAEKYELLCHQFSKKFPNIDNFFENFLIMIIFRFSLPFAQTDVWKSYNHLCSIYSVMLFCTIVSSPSTAEDIIDILALLSRSTLNSKHFVTISLQEMEQHKSNSFAHLAILLRP